MSVVRLVYIVLWNLHFASQGRSETLLLATESGVKTLDTQTSSLTTVHNFPASSVDFRYKRDIYSVRDNIIFYSYFSHYTGNYSEPIKRLVPQRLVDLAVDWRTYELYCTSEPGNIYEAPLSGGPVEKLAEMKGATITDIALDVYDRRFFYVKDRSLYFSRLHVKQASRNFHPFQFATDFHGIPSVYKVAVDHRHSHIYVIGHDEKLRWKLISSSYNNTDSILLFAGPQLTRPFALGVFDGEVIWGSHLNGTSTIYSCKSKPNNDVKIIYKTDEVINDVKFYIAQVQTQEPRQACEELACSHNCTVVNTYLVRCTCPPGLAVGPGGNICVEEERAGLGAVSLFLMMVRQLLTSLMDCLLTWLSSQTSYVTIMVLTACVVMVTIVTCLLCILWCVKIPKRRPSESYDLSEMSHRAATRGDSGADLPRNINDNN